MTSPPRPRILLVDDSEATREVLQRNLEAESYDVWTAVGVSEALGVLREREVDLVVTDIKMPRTSGMELVRHIQDNLKHTEVVVITGYPNVAGAVEAMKHGAVDYLTKPFTDAELHASVRRALDRVDMRRPLDPEDAATAPPGLLGSSPPMRRVFEQVRRAARTKATVLITGESGTGKELVARAIHYESPRSPAAFVPVNCGAIPAELLESELFGHVKGAFTGATETRAGFFLTAEGGTVFLDEIGETSLAMQVKLLRVLQDGEVRMIGSNRSTRPDVRIIAATNKDLAQLVKKGAFREDLYFRINVITIDAPPLRERGGDVVLLLSHFAAKHADEVGRPVIRFGDRALEALQAHSWPGNVRELDNLVQRLAVMAEDALVDVADLPAAMRYSAWEASRRPPDRTLARVESEYIQEVLRSVGGNKSRAAEILGIDRKTLRAKLDGMAPGDGT